MRRNLNIALKYLYDNSLNEMIDETVNVPQAPHISNPDHATQTFQLHNELIALYL